MYFDPKSAGIVEADASKKAIEKNTKAGGTYRYMSPEQIKGEISPKIDIWAFGCVLLYFVTGMEPYIGIPEEKLIHTISVQQISPLDHLITHHIEKTDELIGYS